MVRTKEEQEQHDLRVCLAGRFFKSRGYEVGTDAPCGIATIEVPTFEHGGETFKPDVYAKKGDFVFIAEVETESTIDLEETRREIEVFSNYAVVYIYVPLHVEQRMRENLMNWGLYSKTRLLGY